MYDTVIQNTTLIDGLGNPGQDGVNIGIKSGKIAHISSESLQGKDVIDGSGKVTAPGFIDITNHSDTHLTLFTQPRLTSMVRQGITTIIGGNCGSSLAPLVNYQSIKSLRKWVDVSQINMNWESMKDFLDVVNEYPVVPHFGTFVGYATIRRAIVPDNRPLTEQEYDTIFHCLEESLEQGALGVSLGLAFSHMSTIENKEVRDIARCLKRHNKLLAVHIRSDGEYVRSSLQELLTVSQETGVALHINHLKIMGRKNWKYFDQVYQDIENHLQYEIPFSFDVFPYKANNTVLYLLLPHWVTKNGRENMLKQLADSDMKTQVVADMKANGYDYNRIIVSEAGRMTSAVGHNIAQIAYNHGVGVEEALVDLIYASEGRARVMVEGISDDHLGKLIHHAASCISTDGIGYQCQVQREFPHPRSYGTMSRFLTKYVDEKLSLEQAIAKITSFPARQLGINRGRLQEGWPADIVIFDPDQLTDLANFRNSEQYPKGINQVFIEGKKVYNEGTMHDVASGSIIRL